MCNGTKKVNPATLMKVTGLNKPTNQLLTNLKI